MKRVLLALSLLAAVPAAPAFALPTEEPARPFLVADYEPGVEEALEEGKRELAEGHIEQALSLFQDMASQNPGDPAIEALLSDAQHKACAVYIEQGRALIAEKKYQDAQNAFASALDILPDDPDAKKGKQLAADWPHADALIQEATKRLAGNQVAHAVTYFQQAYDLTGDPGVKKLLDQAKAKKK